MNAAQRKLDLLLKRQGELKAALQALREKQKLAAEREQEKLALIVGRALLSNAAKFPDFDLMLRGVLQTSIVPGSSECRFLQSKGYLP